MSLPDSPRTGPLSVYSIGLKLRMLRIAKHLTLSRLATQTGCSSALLSKLETDNMVPTLQTLDRICRVYGIGLGHFFCEPRHHSVSVTRGDDVDIGRENRRAHTTPLNVPTCDGLLVSQVMAIPAGISITTGECGSVTETTAHVLEGTLQVSGAGTSEVLETGDSIVISSNLPVVWSAVSKRSCRILSVSSKHAKLPPDS